MNTNFKFSLEDDERVALARLITGRPGATRPATRKQIIEFMEGQLAAAIELGEQCQAEPAKAAPAPGGHDDDDCRPFSKLECIDPEDADILAGETPGFIRGWNTAKLGLARRKST